MDEKPSSLAVGRGPGVDVGQASDLAFQGHPEPGATLLAFGQVSSAQDFVLPLCRIRFAGQKFVSVEDENEGEGALFRVGIEVEEGEAHFQVVEVFPEAVER